MDSTRGHILIVDDNDINRRVLAGLMTREGHSFAMAVNGLDALAQLKAGAFDVVLLDVMMPKMDGYETLTRIKADPDLKHLPVIMISAVDEMESVIRCISSGATDYLPKPFNAALLRARIDTSLAGKRLRDLEREYLEQVGLVSAAASAIEAGEFKSEMLDSVAARTDALGRLAAVFQHMAGEVYARERRLKAQLAQLQSDIEEHQRALGDSAATYLPMDRRQALVHGLALPDRVRGAGLFADISGFTPLTESLARELGLQRGAEEITRHLNRVYDTLVEQVHRFGGSVIVFGGDAITCWFDGDDGLRAAACALAMQAAMRSFDAVQTPGGLTLSIGIKVAVAAGQARRFLVGDPAIQRLEVLAGRLLDTLSETEQCAKRGEVLAAVATARQLGAALQTDPGRGGSPEAPACVPVRALAVPVAAAPWEPIPLGRVSNETAKSWLSPLVYGKVCSGESEFLSELRPAAALMLKFSAMDYDADETAPARLDAFVRWVQSVLRPHDGALMHVSVGDKGSSLCATFGAPTAHPDDAARAVKAAWELVSPPPELAFVGPFQIGLAHGLVRAGAYGSVNRRSYGVIGDRINLAARLMMAAPAGGILCDEAICHMAQAAMDFEFLPPLTIKGKAAPVAVCRPLAIRRGNPGLIDQLTPSRQVVLKVASVLGERFEADLLRDIYPVENEKPHLAEHLRALVEGGLLAESTGTPGRLCYRFPDPQVQRAAYNLMLFSQRRQLHRQAADWIVSAYGASPAGHHVVLARHFQGAEDYPQAILCLEKAGAEAREQGQLAEAQMLLQQSLALEQKVRGQGDGPEARDPTMPA